MPTRSVSLTAAIDLLQKLPDSPERIQQEALLQLAVGPALPPAKGWAAPEVERAYTRARELCERLGDPPELFPVLFGLWIVYFVARPSYRGPMSLLNSSCGGRRARTIRTLVLYAQLALGITLVLDGRVPSRQEAFRNGDLPLRS